MTAFALLTVGYFALGLVPTFLESAGLVTYGAGNAVGLGENANNSSWIIETFRSFFVSIGVGNFDQLTSSQD